MLSLSLHGTSFEHYYVNRPIDQ